MYLSQLILNQRNRAVREDLADCQCLHRRILSAFPDIQAGESGARQRFGVLYRAETNPRRGEVAVVVQSGAKPDWTRLPANYLTETNGGSENPACKSIDGYYDQIRPDMELIFRLRANPTKRVSKHSTTERSGAAGKRVELQTEEEWIDWLNRKGQAHGFDILAVETCAKSSANEPHRVQDVFGVEPRSQDDVPDVRSVGSLKVTGSRNNKRLTFGSVLFEGRLRVSDTCAFRDALKHGVGPAKAYGFGLLSIAPTRR